MTSTSFIAALSLSIVAPLILSCQAESTETTAKGAPITEREITASDTRIHIMGRFDHAKDGAIRYSYPGVTTEFNYLGRALSIRIASSHGQNYLDVIIDDQAPIVLNLPPSGEAIEIIHDEVRTEHKITLIHRSETWQGVVTFNGISITDGDLLNPQAPAARKMLILGDSVTCGEAIDRFEGEDKNPTWWNSRLSYGYLTAQALHAQVHLVCYGGRGLVRTWDGKTDQANLEDYFEQSLPLTNESVIWDHRLYQPDLILSAIGTNDFSLGIPDKKHYLNKYQSLITRLQTLHPKAQIVLTEGAILEGDKKAALTHYLQTIVNESQGKVSYIPSQHYPGDVKDAHPTKDQHQSMAKDLTPRLRELMAW